jgi:hypothetical protein
MKSSIVRLLAFLAVCSLAIGCGDKKENKSSESTSKADDKDDKKSKKDDKGSNKKPKATFDAAKRTSLTSEAKNSVGKIARGALMAYERESMGEGDAVVHALCKSATPVPEKVPSAGESYKPKSDAGVDFNAGDEKTGWPCLKFTSDAPINFQYSYTEGSTPKLAARGKDVAKGEARRYRHPMPSARVRHIAPSHRDKRRNVALHAGRAMNGATACGNPAQI